MIWNIVYVHALGIQHQAYFSVYLACTTLLFYEQYYNKDLGCSSVVEHMLSMPEVLGSTLMVLGNIHICMCVYTHIYICRRLYILYTHI